MKRADSPVSIEMPQLKNLIWNPEEIPIQYHVLGFFSYSQNSLSQNRPSSFAVVPNDIDATASQLWVRLMDTSHVHENGGTASASVGKAVRNTAALGCRVQEGCKPGLASDITYLWLVGNGGMGYNYNYYYYHSSIPY